MDLMTYIDKGGIIVYILIGLNIIGFTIILWKFFTLIRKNKIIENIKDNINPNRPITAQIEYEVQKLESGLTTIKNIASISPLLGLLGTVIGVYISFEEITVKGLGDPTIFSNGIGRTYSFDAGGDYYSEKARIQLCIISECESLSDCDVLEDISRSRGRLIIRSRDNVPKRELLNPDMTVNNLRRR